MKSFISGTFFNTSINEIVIPASIEELDDMCFNGMNFLKEITISDKNKHFTFLDDKKRVVVAKSDPSNEDYDVIVYAIRNIRKVVIPSFVRSIRPYAFSDCIKLIDIEFSEGSQLQSIGSSAFNMASFDEIVIPSHVNFIGEYAFNLCKNLKKIEFEKNSELIEFNCNLFNESAFESISFPDYLQRLSDGWCFKTSYLNNIYLSPENKNFVFPDEKKKNTPWEM